MTVVETPRQIAATATADAALVAGKHTPVDATSGNRTLTLPTAITAGAHLSVEKVDSSTHTVTVTGSIRGVGASSLTLVWQYESVTFVADAAGSWWPTAGHKTKAALDATYQALANAPKYPDTTSPATAVPRPVWADLRDYISSGFTGSDYSSPIQAMLDASAGKDAVIAPGIWTYATTLKLNTNQVLRAASIGSATSDLNPTILQFQGGSTANGVEAATPGSTSRISLEGLRLEDRRTSPTSGTGIYLDGVKNLIRMKTMNVFYWPTDAIAIVTGASGTSVENISLEDIWASCSRYGVNISGLDNVAHLTGIYGDSKVASAQHYQALINIDSSNGGNSVVTIAGAKGEVDSGAHILRIGSSFLAACDAAGLVMRGVAAAGSGGDVVNIQNNNSLTTLSFRALQSVNVANTGAVAANLVNDVANGKTYGPAGKRMTRWERSNNVVSYFYGGVQYVNGAPIAPSVAAVPRSGRWVYPVGGASATVTMVGGTPRYIPVTITRACTITEIDLEVTTVGSAGALLRLGIYADDGNGFPTGAPLVDAGTVDAATSTGLKSVTGLSLAVTPGTYWLCAVTQGSPATNPQVRAMSSVVAGVVGYGSGQSNVAGYVDSSATVTGPLPSNPGLASNGFAPLVHVKVS